MLHLFKDQPEDGPTTGPKHVAGIITKYNLIKYNVVYDCIIYIYIFALKENYFYRKIPRSDSWRPWDRKLTDYVFPQTVIVQIISYITQPLCWNHVPVHFGIGNVGA